MASKYKMSRGRKKDTTIDEEINKFVPRGGFPSFTFSETDKKNIEAKKINVRGFDASKKINLNDMLNKVPELPGGAIDYQKFITD